MSESNMQNTHSPYTPTTEEVRPAFRKGSRIDWNSRRGRLFDRWLNEVKAQAWEEGYAQGSADSYDSRLDADNPYREGVENES